MRYSYDRDKKEPTYVVVKEEDQYSLKSIYKDAVIADQEIEDEGEENLNVVCFNSQGKQYVLVQNGKSLIVYKQGIKDDGNVTLIHESKLSHKDEITEQIHSVVTRNLQDHLVLFSYKNAYIFNFRPLSFTKVANADCSYCMNDNVN